MSTAAAAAVQEFPYEIRVFIGLVYSTQRSVQRSQAGAFQGLPLVHHIISEVYDQCEQTFYLT